MQNLDENQARVLFEDYMEELGKFPHDILQGACRAYRNNPQNTFFPKVAQLLELCQTPYRKLLRKLNALNQILSADPNLLRLEVSRPKAVDFEELTKSLEAIPDPIAGKPQSTMPAYDRTWFEKKHKKHRVAHEHSHE